VPFERPGAGASGAGANPETATDADAEAVARILCLRQLDARARTRAELAAYLNRKGVPPEPAARVLDRFTQVGLIDDSALAGSFVESRHREAGLARRALTQKLRQRGVADEVIESAVAVVDSEAELTAARDLVRRKLRSVAALEPQVQARRLVGMLARKGYPPGLAYHVVRERLSEAELPTGVDD
jgi:regulatory protein